MAINLVRVTANVAGGTTYTPNFLLSSFHVLTLGAGAITIAPAISVGPGDIIAIKVIFPNPGVCALTWAPEYMLSGNNYGEFSGGNMTYGFFCEGGSFQRIWTGSS